MSDQIVRHSASIHLNGDLDTVFPLFTAIGEYKWVPDWKAEFIYPPSGEPMINNIFITQHAGRAPTTWITVDYNTETHHVEYINVTPESHAQRVEIQCQRAADGTTNVQVSYTIIALRTAGSTEVEHYTQAVHTERMSHWQQAINHYLAHAAPISSH